MEVTYKLSLNSGNSIFSGRIENTSMKNNKYRNLLWIMPTKCNGRMINENKRSLVCISTFNLVSNRR